TTRFSATTPVRCNVNIFGLNWKDRHPYADAGCRNMINGLLEQVNKDLQVYNIWLADTAIPDGLTEEDGEATIPPMNTVEEVFTFLATVPLGRSLNRTYIIVMTRNLYEQKN
ncbi:hypothetical protein D6D23_05258, partial [Aureobasidium pullulans]